MVEWEQSFGCFVLPVRAVHTHQKTQFTPYTQTDTATPPCPNATLWKTVLAIILWPLATVWPWEFRAICYTHSYNVKDKKGFEGDSSNGTPEMRFLSPFSRSRKNPLRTSNRTWPRTKGLSKNLKTGFPVLTPYSFLSPLLPQLNLEELDSLGHMKEPPAFPVPALPLSRPCQASHFISLANEKVRTRWSLMSLLNQTLSMKIDLGPLFLP